MPDSRDEALASDAPTPVVDRPVPSRRPSTILPQPGRPPRRRWGLRGQHGSVPEPTGRRDDPTDLDGTAEDASPGGAAVDGTTPDDYLPPLRSPAFSRARATSPPAPRPSPPVEPSSWVATPGSVAVPSPPSWTGDGTPDAVEEPRAAEPEEPVPALVAELRRELSEVRHDLRGLVGELTVEIDRSARDLRHTVAVQRRELAAALDDMAAARDWLSRLREQAPAAAGTATPPESPEARHDVAAPSGLAVATPAVTPQPAPTRTAQPEQSRTRQPEPMPTPEPGLADRSGTVDARAMSAAAARIGLPTRHVDALQRWVASGHRAVVDVAHAGGRHRVGLAAVVYAAARGRQVTVVVPDRRSAEDWRLGIAAHAPELAVRVPGPDAPSPTHGADTDVLVVPSAEAGPDALAGRVQLVVAVDARSLTQLAAPQSPWRLALTDAPGGVPTAVTQGFGGASVSVG